MSGFFDRMGARATGQDAPLRLRRPEPYEGIKSTQPAVADVQATEPLVHDVSVVDASPPPSPVPLRPRSPEQGRQRSVHVMSSDGSAQSGRPPPTTSAGQEPSRPSAVERRPRLPVPTAQDAGEPAGATSPAEHNPVRGQAAAATPPISHGTVDADPPSPGRTDARAEPALPDAAPARPAAVVRAGSRTPSRPDPGPVRTPAVDVAALLRDHLGPALVERGLVTPDERLVVDERPQASAVSRRRAPRRGTVEVSSGSVTTRPVTRAEPGSGQPDGGAGPGAAGIGPPGAVHLHIDRVVVTRAQASAAPTPPPRPIRSTVDHAAYLARRRERR